MPFSKNPRRCDKLENYSIPDAHILSCDICSNTLLPEYFLWLKIRRRCHSPRDKNYPKYGGVGIELYPEWRSSFVEFYNYIGPKPSEEHVLKRLDVTKHYEPGNVAWRKPGELRNPDVVPKYLTVEYRTWESMIQRCHNPNSTAYSYYGGRGIRVCDEWRKSSDAFLDYMGPRPTPHHSIDRYPDQNGNYEPGNVRWATAKQQARNVRSNRLINHNGEMISLSELAERTGIKRSSLGNRLENGWSEDSLTKELRVPALINDGVESLSSGKMAQKYGMKPWVLQSRLKHGWDLQRALTTPTYTAATFEYKGEWLTLREISERSGLKFMTLHGRARQGLRGDDLVAPSKRPRKNVLQETAPSLDS